MTRVVFLTESFHPVLGGGEQHILRLSRRLVEGGMPATVVTRRGDAGWPREESTDGVRVLRVPPAGPSRTGKYEMVPAAIGALVRERARYDVLVVRGTRVLGLPGLVAARALGKPVVLQAEVNGELSGEVFTWGRFAAGSPAARAVRAAFAARNLLFRDADCFVAMSRGIACEMRQAGVAEHKVALVPHGVDTRRFRPAEPALRLELRRRLSLPADGLAVVYSGRLLRGKGLEPLLDAFAAARAAEPRLLLLLLGSGEGQSLSVEGQLRERVRRSGLEPCVRFVGRVDDVERYLQACDVFVLPSLFEALGLALVEAAACGLACIGTRTGGIVDVIEDERSGLLVEPGDTAGLRRALERLAADAGLRGRLGDAARAHVRAAFDEEDAVSSYRALFSELHARSAFRGGARA